MTKPRILVVEDDREWREVYLRCLDSSVYDVVAEQKLSAALKALEEEPFDVIITDLEMIAKTKDFSGFAVLQQARARRPDVPVIVITSFGSADHALRAMGSGAYAYITKDHDLRKQLVLTVQAALKVRPLKHALLEKRLEDDAEMESDRFIANSTNMQALFEQMCQAADRDQSILIKGEEGTGKQLIAQMIHRQSQRQDRPFFAVDCGQSESVVEREVFGHGETPGKLERGEGGTVYLKKSDALSARLQTRLLDVICNHLVKRTSAQEPICVDVRIIASMTGYPDTMIMTDPIQKQLLDILGELVITVPPLRDRKDSDDILALSAMFLRRYSGDRKVEFSTESLELLQCYDYPGNVSELESVIRRALACTRGEVIPPEHLPPEIRRYATMPLSGKASTEITPTQLYDLLIERFDDSEIRELCLRSSIDYEALSGQTKKDKARELVAHCERRGCLTELAEVCRRMRPDISR